MEPITKITVVGGPRAVATRMEQRLAEHNVQVLAHVGELEAGKNKSMTSLPVGTDGVVIMVDSCGHALYEDAKTLASKAGVPLIGIPRKWAKAEAILRAQGVMPPATNGSTRTPKAEDLEDLALSYVCEEREKGRVPKIEEVNAMLQRAFGPKVMIEGSQYGEVTSKAAARVPLAPETKKEIHDRQRKEVRAWVQALVEEDPSRILSTNGLIAKVRTDLGEDHVSHLNRKGAAAVRTKVREIRERFRSLDPKDQAWRKPLMLRWIESLFRQAIEGKSVPYRLPNKAAFDGGSKEVFGVVTHYALVPEARANVLGEWARDVIRNGQALIYYNKRASKPLSKSGFEALLTKGKIPSFYSGKQWFTSKLAVDEYLTEKVAPQATPKPKKVDEVPATKKGRKIELDDDLKPVPKSPDLSDPMVFKPVVESVVLEVMTMIKGVVAEAVNKAMEPIVAQVNGLEASLEQGQKAVAESITSKREDASGAASKIATRLAGLDNALSDTQLVARATGNTVAEIHDQAKKVPGLFKVIRDHHDHTNMVFKDLHEALKALLEAQVGYEAQVEKLGEGFVKVCEELEKRVPATPTGPDMLSGLAQLHATAGLEFSISTPKKESGD